MKSINELIQNTGQTQVIEQPQARTFDERQIRAGEAVNKLFARLFAILPAAKRSIEQNDPLNPNKALGDVKAEWVAEIMESGLNQKMVEIGLKKLRKRENPFMPSAGEFFALCRPSEEDLGIPLLESAYIEACQHTRGKKPESYSHVIVYEAASMTGFFELASKPASTMRPLFKANYNMLKEKLIKGEEIHVLSNAIEDQSNKDPVDTRTPEEKELARKKAAEQALNAMKGLIG